MTDLSVPNSEMLRSSHKKSGKSETIQNHKHTLEFLMLANMSIPLIYSVMSSFFPIVALSKGLQQKHSGIVLAAFPLCGALYTLFVSRISNKISLKSMITIGFAAQGLSFFSLGAAYYLQKDAFFIVSLVTRLVEGAFAGGLEIAVRTYCLRLYGEQAESKMGYLQAATLLGFLVGPAVGSCLYYYCGYTLCMCVLGCYLLSINSIFIKFLTPIDDSHSDDQQQKSLCPLLKKSIFSCVIISLTKIQKLINNNQRVLGFFVVVFATALFMSMILTSISSQLTSFGKSSIDIGIAFMATTFVSGVTAFMNGKIPSSLDRRLLIFCGALFIGLGCLVMAPLEYSQLMQKTTFHKIVCVYIGGCFAACGFSFVWVPALPQIKKAVERTHVNHNDAMISLLAAAIFNFADFAGSISGPPTGGVLVDNFAFQKALEWSGVAMLIVSIGFFAMTGYVPDKFSEWRQQRKNKQELTEKPKTEEEVSLLVKS